MQRGTRVDDPALPVVLSEARMLEKARELAAVMGEVDRLEDALSAHQKKAKKEINDRMGVASRLAREIRSQEEFRDQSTLKFDEDPANKPKEPTPLEAAQALAAVATRVVVERVDGREYFREQPEKCTKCEGHLVAVDDRRSDGKGEAAAGSYQGLCGWICSNEECLEMHWLEPDVANADPEPVAVEDEREADGPPQCIGCNNELTATEIVKKLGLCEGCQLAKPAPADLSIDDVQPTEIEDDDPRPRCSECRGVLTPDEVSAELGMCSPCVDKATASGEVDAEVQA